MTTPLINTMPQIAEVRGKGLKAESFKEWLSRKSPEAGDPAPILLPDRQPTASARWFRISAPAEYVWSRHLMERVNNTVRLKVWKGFIVVGRKGPNRLPPPHLQ
ncbi:hypothetical protein, partial [Mesorhizobium sp. LNJC395A00]|uniref:hypothetical protein n=1 Tax=Mesorhizobium sp. LNJC395A00 TaxID=1287275 RepID=UPI001AEBFFAF